MQRELYREHKPPGRGSLSLFSHSLLFLHEKKKYWHSWQTNDENIMRMSGFYGSLQPAFSLISLCVVRTTCTHCQDEFDNVKVSFKSLTYLICTAVFFAPSPHPFSRCIIFNDILEKAEIIAPLTLFKYLCTFMAVLSRKLGAVPQVWT